MKKFLSVILVLFSLLFISCAEQPQKAKLQLPLKLTANISGTEVMFSADISKNGCNVTFSSPDTMKSLELRFAKGESIAKIGDFERPIKIDVFPAQKAMLNAIDKIVSQGEIVFSEEGVAKYTIDETVIMVYYDKDKCAITRIETEESGRRFCFDIVSLEFYEAQS